MSSESAPYRSYSLNKEQIPPVIVEKLDDIERINLKEKIKKKLKQQEKEITMEIKKYETTIEDEKETVRALEQRYPFIHTIVANR